MSVQCLCLLAERDKKCGNWTRAVLLWQKAVHAVQYSDWPDWEAHIELAMYYEHKTKQLEASFEACRDLALTRAAAIFRPEAG